MFTGVLYVLQSEPASRTPRASVHFAFQLTNEGECRIEVELIIPKIILQRTYDHADAVELCHMIIY